MDYELTDSLLLGVKGRWVDYDSFEDGGGGVEPAARASALPAHFGAGRRGVTGSMWAVRVELDDIEMFAISMNLKYQF